MCGIVGFVRSDSNSDIDTLACVDNMMTAIAHRGPDARDATNFSIGKTQVGLGHVRLSILDLSTFANQPMYNTRRDSCIVFNGEIYNFIELKEELILSGVDFGTSSDTEVLLYALDEWGVNKTLSKLIGMFSFAYINIEKRSVVLARDRAGEKPLYYYVGENGFAFASELKALEVLPFWGKSLNICAVQEFLRFGYISGEKTIYDHIHRLKPGNVLEFSLDEDFSSIKKFSSIEYWSIKGKSKEYCKPTSIQEAFEVSEHLIRQSIKLQLRADVPVGSFLSGGLDSSLVTALMQQESGKQIKTFSIGFSNNDYNEAPIAQEVATALGTDHNELIIDFDLASKVLLEALEAYDEPFADTSLLPTFIVSKFARNQVKVVLSGDAGDELYLGYNRYLMGAYIWKTMKKLSSLGTKTTLEILLHAFPSSFFQNVLTFFYDELRFLRLSEKKSKLVKAIRSNDFEEFYQSLSITHDSSKYLRLNEDAVTLDQLDAFRLKNYFEIEELEVAASLTDFQSYLPDDILVKVDRASMANGLEVRAPLLDYRVIEHAYSLSMKYKVDGSKGKLPIRHIVEKYLPKSIFNRPKTGFSLPLGFLITGEVKSKFDFLFSESNLRKHTLIDSRSLSRFWANLDERNLQELKVAWIWGCLLNWLDCRGLKLEARLA